jgi:xylulokinase
MNYLLAHDLGTSGDKVALFDENGRLVQECTISYPTNYFNANRAEQNPDDWWDAVCKGTKQVIENVNPARICAVSFSGHMMGCLCVDKDGTPLRPSIIWSDRRSEEAFAELRKTLGEDRIFKTTGHRGSGNYTLPKLMWVKKHEPDIYAKMHKTLQAKEYIIFKLTNRFASEPTDGVGTLAMDITSRTWSDEVLGASGIDKEKFPEVLKSTDVAGRVTRAVAGATGLAEGTPVVMGGGDGVMAGIGTGAVNPGDSFMSFGSSSWVSTVSTRPMFDDGRRNTNWPHVIDGLYLNDGVMQSAGGSYVWAKRTLVGAADSNSSIETMLGNTPPGANGVIFLPYLLGERCPWWNPDAKGAFLGVRMETTKADMLRAVLEGVAYHMACIAELLRGNGAPLRDVTVVGGGARGITWPQILADAIDANIHVPSLLESATSFGAAIVGGVGIGLYGDFERATKKFVSINYVYRPDPGRVELYRQKRELFLKSYDALAPLCAEF